MGNLHFLDHQNKGLMGQLTLGLQRERRKFEKQPSQTIVRGANAANSRPSLVLYCTPLIVPFSSSREVTVPCSKRTLVKDGKKRV